jgi:hypothetical protein
MKESIAALGTRRENAYRSLVDTLAERGAGEHAERVAKLYLKERIATLDPVIGQFKIKNGAYLAPDVIERAVTVALALGFA